MLPQSVEVRCGLVLTQRNRVHHLGREDLRQLPRRYLAVVVPVKLRHRYDRRPVLVTFFQQLLLFLFLELLPV